LRVFVTGREIEISISYHLYQLDVKKLIEKEGTLEEGVQALMDMDKGSQLCLTMITFATWTAINGASSTSYANATLRSRC